jgi:isoquinoline 1-oxidoreductase beta subunit
MNQINTSLTRRAFVVASASAAGGLAISVALSGFADAATIGPQTFGPDTVPNEINAFLAIDPDGSILIRSPHNEMGQGAITALPMIVAE